MDNVTEHKCQNSSNVARLIKKSYRVAKGLLVSFEVDVNTVLRIGFPSSGWVVGILSKVSYLRMFNLHRVLVNRAE